MIPLVLALRLSALTEVHISCNMGTRDLPEMYALSPRAAPSDFGHTFFLPEMYVLSPRAAPLDFGFLANHSCPCYNYKYSYMVPFK